VQDANMPTALVNADSQEEWPMTAPQLPCPPAPLLLCTGGAEEPRSGGVEKQGSGGAEVI